MQNPAINPAEFATLVPIKALMPEQIRELLKLKDRKYFRKYYITPALEIGAIEYTIPDKPRSRMQKYRLTGLGRKILSETKDVSGQ